MRLTRLAILLAAAAAMTLSVAALARADADVSVAYGGHRLALATFIAYGDEFRICDLKQDGLPVALRYSYIRKNGSVQRGYLWHSQGVAGRGTPSNTGFTTEGCSFEDHNFAEGRRVWFQACVRQRNGNLTCGGTQVTGTGRK